MAARGGETTALSERKFARDGGETYHLTTFSPRETRALRKAGIDVAAITDTVNVTLDAIGSVSETLDDDENVVYYVICSSDALTALRATYGLPPHDLHITLGFSQRDIHNQPKDATTAMVSIN